MAERLVNDWAGQLAFDLPYEADFTDHFFVIPDANTADLNSFHWGTASRARIGREIVRVSFVTQSEWVIVERAAEEPGRFPRQAWPAGTPVDLVLTEGLVADIVGESIEGDVGNLPPGGEMDTFLKKVSVDDYDVTWFDLFGELNTWNATQLFEVKSSVTSTVIQVIDEDAGDTPIFAVGDTVNNFNFFVTSQGDVTAHDVVVNNLTVNGTVTGLPPTSAAVAVWLYNNSPAMNDPGAGKVRTDNNTASLVTQVAFSATTDGGTDFSRVFESLQAGDTIYVQDQENAGTWARYTVAGVPTDNGTWFLVPVAYDGGVGASSNNDRYLVQFSYSGVPDGVALLAATQTFTGGNTFDGGTVFNGGVTFNYNFSANGDNSYTGSETYEGDVLFLSTPVFDNGFAVIGGSLAAAGRPLTIGTIVAQNTAATTPVTVKGAAGQTADLLKVTTSSNALLGGYKADGSLYFASSFLWANDGSGRAACGDYTTPTALKNLKCFGYTTNLDGSYLGPDDLQLRAALTIGWSSTTTYNNTKDTGLARDSAGVLRVTDGSTGRGTVLAGVVQAVATGVAVTPLLAKGAASQSADLLQCLDSSGNVKTRVTKDGWYSSPSENVNEVTGDQHGTARLRIQARDGIIGGLFEAGSAVDLVDMGFKTLSHTMNLRVESRGGSGLGGTVPEMQFFKAGATPQLCVAETFVYFHRRMKYLQSKPTINANTNNWDVSSYGPIVQIQGSGAFDITGMITGTANTDGEVRYVMSRFSGTLTFKQQSGSSTAGNRFYSHTGADVALTGGRMLMCVYDGSDQVWRIFLLP